MTTAAELHEAEQEWRTAGRKVERLKRKLWKEVRGFDWPADINFAEDGVNYVMRARVEVHPTGSEVQNGE